MKTTENQSKEQIAKRILADVYSCMKVVYKMNIDHLDSDIMIKVLVNHFDLKSLESDINISNENFMVAIDSVCETIHNNPLKYFNFSYRKPRN